MPNPNRQKKDSMAKCLTPPDQPISSTSNEHIPSTSKEPIPDALKKVKKASKNDWECVTCKKKLQP